MRLIYNGTFSWENHNAGFGVLHTGSSTIDIDQIVPDNGNLGDECFYRAGQSVFHQETIGSVDYPSPPGPDPVVESLESFSLFRCDYLTAYVGSSAYRVQVGLLHKIIIGITELAIGFGFRVNDDNVIILSQYFPIPRTFVPTISQPCRNLVTVSDAGSRSVFQSGNPHRIETWDWSASFEFLGWVPCPDEE